MNKAERIMNLTESQLFTIEALNRIDGFEWPDGAKLAAMDNCVSCVDFYVNKVILHDCSLHFTGKRSHLKPVHIGYVHPDWRNSLITREQFESVDGWVRNDSDSAPMINSDALIDVSYLASVGLIGVKPESVKCDYSIDSWTNVLAWRYHKPTKETEMKTEEKQPSIEGLYEKYQTLASSLIDAQMQVDYLKKQSEEALAEIKKWHHERGFSVSVIGADVSAHDNGVELNITDWRDLRVGDEIECIKPCGGRINRGDIGVITQMDKYNVIADFENQRNYLYEGGGFGVRWKFLRRP